MAAQTKYRPSLTVEQITHLVFLAKAEVPMTTMSATIIGKLAPFITKIDNLAIGSAYTTAAKPRVKANSLESLGGDIATANHLDSELAGFSKEQIWELAYNKYQLDPQLCTLRDIADSKEHMYLNDLMSEEDAKKFELGEL